MMDCMLPICNIFWFYYICIVFDLSFTEIIRIKIGQVIIDLVTVFDPILASRQTREKLQCLYENLMSNNFRKTAVLKKISIVN